jgi:hypothetical protein
MGRAEDLFARLKNEGSSAVKQLIVDAQTENLWLDFKRSGNDGNGSKLHESDWKSLAKALSGFANSDGGVILWGVDCASDPILGDVPTGTAPLQNPTRFVSWLENAVSACAVPTVPSVESMPIIESGSSGYVATLVPASPLAPHQCVKPVGSLSYYLRAGSSFMQVPHAVLAGMFGRRPQPKVFQTYQGTAAIDGEGQGIRLTVNAFIHVYNEGPAIARDAFMHLLLGIPGGGSKGGCQPDPSGTGNWISQFEFGVLASVMAKADFRIAPQMFVGAFRIFFELAEPFDSGYGLKISVGCGGAPMHVAEIRYEPAEVQSKYQAALSMLLENKPGAQDAVLDLFLPK